MRSLEASPDGLVLEIALDLVNAWRLRRTGVPIRRRPRSRGRQLDNSTSSVAGTFGLSALVGSGIECVSVVLTIVSPDSAPAAAVDNIGG